jgi:tryptophan halogenase
MIGQHIVPGAYHPLVDLVSDDDLEKLCESVRGVVASCVAVMPAHEQFIARCCQAPVAA